MTNKQLTTALGASIMLCGFSLFGMYIGSAGTACETNWIQSILLMVGAYCTVAKGWSYVVVGQDLNVKPDN